MRPVREPEKLPDGWVVGGVTGPPHGAQTESVCRQHHVLDAGRDRLHLFDLYGLRVRRRLGCHRDHDWGSKRFGTLLLQQLMPPLVVDILEAFGETRSHEITESLPGPTGYDDEAPGVGSTVIWRPGAGRYHLLDQGLWHRLRPGLGHAPSEAKGLDYRGARTLDGNRHNLDVAPGWYADLIRGSVNLPERAPARRRTWSSRPHPAAAPGRAWCGRSAHPRDRSQLPGCPPSLPSRCRWSKSPTFRSWG